MTHTPSGFASFPLDNLVLGLLIEQPKHGYQLYQDYIKAFSPIWMIGRSKFYAALTEVQSHDLLDCQTELQGDRPPRKIYRLTEAGHNRFTSWLHEPVSPVRAIRVEFIAKLRFFDLLHLAGALELIAAQRDLCQRIVRDWQHQRQTLHEQGDDPFFDIVYGFREEQAQFILDWLDECEQQFRPSP